MSLMWIVEITAGIPGSPTLRTLRASSGPIGYNHPSAPGYYPPDVVDAANIRRNIVAPRMTFGPSEIGAGEIVLDNVDGRYDEWFDYGYGFNAYVYLVQPTTPYSQRTFVAAGKVEQPVGVNAQIVFRFRDRQAELDRLISPEYYLGTNSGTTGTEGKAQDIKGQNKIRIFGKPLNVTPDPLNANDRLYGYNHTKAGGMAPVASITQRLNGAPWDIGTDYGSLAALQAGSPVQGDYDTALTLGLERLGGSAPGISGAGGITADIVESSTAATNRMPSVIQRLLLDAGIASGDIDVQLTGSSPSLADWDVGLVIRGETYRAALEMLCSNSAIWYCPNRLGVYQVRKFTPPGTPVAGFKKFNYPAVAASTDYAIKSLERIATSDNGRGVPAWRITVNYAKLWTVQDKDALASSLSDETKEYYSREYRSVTVTNSSIRDQFPEAVELTFDTVLNRQDDAQQLADELMVLYGAPRQMYKLKAQYTESVAAAIDLGDTVRVTHERFGLDNGKNFVITGMRYDAKAFDVELEIWG
jgi:hypothetical protein